MYGADWDGSIYQFKPIEVGVEEEISSRGRFFFAPRGNPAGERVLFELVTSGAGQVRVEIYDMTGRMIDVPFEGGVSAGKREISWDTDSPSGVYFYQALTPWGARTGKLVLIR